ncbi:MAG: hypothetical protein QOH74_324 [Gaiellales bacterium]|nr:hypothetical protein [Gaiellales bacterium]
MKRIHTFVIVVALGVAGVAGTYAAVQTVTLGQASSAASDQQIRDRQQALDRAEADLRKAAKQLPPKVPALPKRSQRATGSSARVTTQVSHLSSGGSSGSDDGDDHRESEDGGD